MSSLLQQNMTRGRAETRLQRHLQRDDELWSAPLVSKAHASAGVSWGRLSQSLRGLPKSSIRPPYSLTADEAILSMGLGITDTLLLPTLLLSEPSPTPRARRGPAGTASSPWPAGSWSSVGVGRRHAPPACGPCLHCPCPRPMLEMDTGNLSQL